VIVCLSAANLVL